MTANSFGYFCDLGIKKYLKNNSEKVLTKTELYAIMKES